MDPFEDENQNNNFTNQFGNQQQNDDYNENDFEDDGMYGDEDENMGELENDIDDQQIFAQMQQQRLNQAQNQNTKIQISLFGLGSSDQSITTSAVGQQMSYQQNQYQIYSEQQVNNQEYIDQPNIKIELNQQNDNQLGDPFFNMTDNVNFDGQQQQNNSNYQTSFEQTIYQQQVSYQQQPQPSTTISLNLGGFNSQNIHSHQPQVVETKDNDKFMHISIPKHQVHQQTQQSNDQLQSQHIRIAQQKQPQSITISLGQNSQQNQQQNNIYQQDKQQTNTQSFQQQHPISIQLAQPALPDTTSITNLQDQQMENQQNMQPIPQQPIQQSITQPVIEQQPIYQTTAEDQYQHHQQIQQKSAKKKKKKSSKGRGQIMDFYELQKIKMTLEIDPQRKMGRGQSLFYLNLKDKDQLQNQLQLIQDEAFKKYILDMGMHAKHMIVTGVQILDKEKGNQAVEFEYPDPIQYQSQFQQAAFSNKSQDLHSLETEEQRIFENSQRDPILQVKRVFTLHSKKGALYEQLPVRIKLLVSYVIELLSEYGIKEVKYQVSSSSQTLNSVQNGDDQVQSYFYTSDAYDQHQLWMPIVKGTLFQQVAWTIRYIVPQTYTVISSGTLVTKQIEAMNDQRALFIYKMKDGEISVPEKIGFIVGKFPIIHRMNDISNFCSQGALSFFMSQKKFDTFTYNNFYEKHLYSILHYLQRLINARYPYNSLKIIFVPNLILKSSRKQSFDFAGGLHIMDEEILFQRNQLENRHLTYKYLSSALTFDFFGGKVYEETPEDYWLLQGLRESLGNHYKIAKCGVLLYRYHIMKTIDNIYKKARDGIERYPLQSNNQPHPSEQMLNELVYEKCELIMHMIESMIDKSYFERIIRQLYESAQPTVSTGLFLKIFKQVCGFKLKQFCQNWILSTGCPKLTATFNYNKKNNSLDLSITQKSAMKNFFMYKRYLKQQIDMGTLFASTTFTDRQSPEVKAAYRKLEPIDSFFVEFKRECMRWFTGEVNVMIYLTDGAEIQTQQQKMSLKYGKTTVSVNIPLHYKVKKTIQNKKKEYENMLLMDSEIQDEQEQHDHDTNAGKNPNQGSSAHHMIDNSSWKFGLNDFELEDYPYGTKNLFEVKNLESPVLWIRVDPDMEYIRKVKVQQDQNNWLFQLLQEKDIIGQIEAIQQLYKFNSELVYEILKSVSMNENYFFKVRKVALRQLQKMQTAQFNKYLSHEKFLIKIFNQRNLDPNTAGFYRSNDFTRVLEYYIDKYILKTLSKCKESPLKLREEVEEQIANLTKQQTNMPTEANPVTGNISIPLMGSDVVPSYPKQTKQPDSRKYNTASDQQAQLLLKLLQENDNSENPFDDASYLKQILKSLGSLDSFKYMPEIAKEIYRQLRLDYIGKWQPQFAITKGAIAGYFNLKKQIFLFKRDKVPLLDLEYEDIQMYEQQTSETQKVLSIMDQDISRIVDDDKWPLEVRSFVVGYQIKHSFLYENNSFMKALYIQLKRIDQLQVNKRVNDAANHMRLLVLFIEDKCSSKLDFKEFYLNNQRSIAIVNILWSMVCLPSSYLGQSLTYWVKRLYHYFFSNEIPPFLKEEQMKLGKKMEEMKYDEFWIKPEDQMQEGAATSISLMGGQQVDRDRHMKQILASRSAQQVIIRTPKDQEKQGILIDTKSDRPMDNKLKIVLGPTTGLTKIENIQKNQQWNKPQAPMPAGPIKISLGGLTAFPTLKQQTSHVGMNESEIMTTGQSTHIRLSEGVQQNTAEQEYQIQLMQSFKNQNENQNKQDVDMPDDDSVYDEFAEIKFPDSTWLQRAWDITGLLWYHEESQAFLEPVTENDLGEYFDYYLKIIEYPIDLTTIKEKIKERQYRDANQWKRDIFTMFRNCRAFNQEDSEIHQSAIKLEKFFLAKLNEFGLSNAIIRIQ